MRKTNSNSLYHNEYYSQYPINLIYFLHQIIINFNNNVSSLCAKITNGEYPNNLHIHYDRAIST